MNENQEIKEFKEKLGELFIALIQMLGAFAVLAVSIAFGGWVVMYLWNGIVPSIFGLTSLTWGQATGVDLLVTFIVAQRKEPSDETLMNRFMYVVFTNLLFMLIGWIVMMFI